MKACTSPLFAFLVCVAALPTAPAGSQTPPVLQIDASSVTAHVSPTLYGLMTEEINHSYDGGLYGELLQNRIFKDDPVAPVHWTLVQDAGAAGAISLDDNQRANETALTTSLRVKIERASPAQRVGVANDGFWGIPIRPETRYRASFYAKADGFAGPLTVAIESADGTAVHATAQVPALSSAWKQYTVSLVTGKMSASANNRFVISANTPGTIWLNLVSLFPPTFKDRPNGNRPDLMQLLADMKPAFLRLPGGNYLEGDTVPTRFDWKKTIHDLADRPGHQGPWRYRSSDGLGLLEFLEWCEDIDVQPVLAVYAGFSMKQPPVTCGPAMQPYVQDALDELEYATSDQRATWGAERAKDGHPAPFKITYVEIGNEDAYDKSHSYDARFTQFFDAIKAKYPKLQVIATAHVRTRTPDLYDEHYYRSAQRFENDVHHYDKYSRTGPKVFVGEWATMEGSPTPNMNAALSDAAWMTGMERNSDVVVLESYAPLFVNVNPGGYRWKTNLIGYDATTSFGSPSYYAQKIFSLNHGDTVLKTTMADLPGFFHCVTRDSSQGTIYLKAVNTSAAPQQISISIQGVTSVASDASMVLLSATGPADTNSITEPVKVVPVTSNISGLSANFPHIFPPYSITILKLAAK